MQNDEWVLHARFLSDELCQQIQAWHVCSLAGLVGAHLAGEEGGQIDEDAEEDDGEDELEEAEGGGAVLLPQTVAVRLADRRVPGKYKVTWT